MGGKENDIKQQWSLDHSHIMKAKVMFSIVSTTQVEANLCHFVSPNSIIGVLGVILTDIALY